MSTIKILFFAKSGIDQLFGGLCWFFQEGNDDNPDLAFAPQSYLLGRCAGKVNKMIGFSGAAVIDGNVNFLAGGRVDHPYDRAQRQTLVGAGHLIGMITVSRGSFSPFKALGVVRGETLRRLKLAAFKNKLFQIGAGGRFR